MIEYDERERMLDSVGPELAHVMVIAVVEKMDRGLRCNVVCGNVAELGNAAIFDNAATFDPAAFFGVIDHFVDFLDGFVIEVAVGADDFRAIKPVDVVASFCCGTQLLHKGLFGVNSREILNRNFHVLKLDKNVWMFSMRE